MRDFNDPIGSQTIFKGGTALSKCYKLIERFSEDIDLVVLRNVGETDNNMKTKITKISRAVETVLPEMNVEGLTVKRGMNRKTAHTYNKEFQGSYGHVRDVIVVEATWLGSYEPFTVESLSSLVGEMMLKNGQSPIAQEYGLLPFEVRVLRPTRTLCEKIMSLVRFSYSDTPVEDLKRKVRHTYDLHQLSQQTEFSNFMNSSDFDSLLLKVANDDVLSFRNNNSWLARHPTEALIFSNLESVWTELKSAYHGDFRNMVYGKLPSDESILKTLRKIKTRLSDVDWNITI